MGTGFSRKKLQKTCLHHHKPKEIPSNADVRRDVAVACRALASYGIGNIDRIYNHVCAVAKGKDGTGTVMLLVPFALPWSAVTPECMMEVDMEAGEEAYADLEGTSITEIKIVKAMVKARPDSTAMFHCHPIYASCLGCIHDHSGAIKCVNVSCMELTRDVAYYVSTGKGKYKSELDRWFECLGENKHVLMLENHGVTTIGHSVAQAFDKMVAAEQACELQVKSLSCGKRLRVIDEDRIERHIKVVNESYTDHAKVHLDSFRHLLPDKCWEDSKSEE